MSLPVLRKLRELARNGAIVIGLRPQGSPSLADNPGEVNAILNELWPGGAVARVGRGRVFADDSPAEALKAIGLKPDFTYARPAPDSSVMFIHRRLAGADIYFLSNRNNRAETIEGSFRVTGRRAELWDPATGDITPASYRIQQGRTSVTVPLDPFGSIFVVFRGEARAEQSRRLPQPVFQTVAELSGPWQVAFQADRGAPLGAVFQQLINFRDSADAGIRYFSGVATYTKSVQLPAVSGGRLWLDLGQVYDLAEVWVNGKLSGTAWKPPYRVDITGAAVAGENRIEIKAVNLWVNRLIGDVQPGVTRKYTFTWVDGKPLPPGVARGGRAPAMPYRADSPLRASGLVGPVRVIHETQRLQ